MIDVSSRAYRQQWGCNFITAIPNNLYGPYDNYDINNGHVNHLLLESFLKQNREVIAFQSGGSGKALREFTFSEDAAKVIWWLSENYDQEDPINIGNTEEISIADLSYMIAKIMYYKGKIIFDTSKPKGQRRKPTSNNKLMNYGLKLSYTPIEEGLKATIEHFINNYPKHRGI